MLETWRIPMSPRSIMPLLRELKEWAPLPTEQPGLAQRKSRWPPMPVAETATGPLESDSRLVGLDIAGPSSGGAIHLILRGSTQCRSSVQLRPPQISVPMDAAPSPVRAASMRRHRGAFARREECLERWHAAGSVRHPAIDGTRRARFAVTGLVGTRENQPAHRGLEAASKPEF